MTLQLFGSKETSNIKTGSNNEPNQQLEGSYSLDVSVIIPCKNELNNIKNTVDSIMNSKNNLSFEIIVVNDGSTDGCCDFINVNRDIYNDVKLIYKEKLGSSAARNLGAEGAIGKYVFFCDAHVKVPNHWLDKLVKTLEEGKADVICPAIKDNVGGGVGYGATWNNNLQFTWLERPERKWVEIPIAPGGAFGIKKDVFEAVGGFETHFEIWGKEDEEISLKLWLFGYKIIVDTSVEIIHLFRTVNPARVTSVEILYNYLCLAYSHFGYKNLYKVLNMVKNTPVFPEALTKIMLNEDLLRQRKEYFSKRKYDENYFLKKFSINF